MELLPNELCKEIFSYFSDIEMSETLRLINKLFLKITNKIQINDGIIVPITANMICKFMETEPNIMSWVTIFDSSSKINAVIYHKLITTDGVDHYLYDVIGVYGNGRVGGPIVRKSSKDICQNIKNNLYSFYPNKYDSTFLFPLKEVIEYFVNNHYLNLYLNNYPDQKSNFIQRSLLKTVGWYIESMKETYPSNPKYIDFYLDLLNIHEDNN